MDDRVEMVVEKLLKSLDYEYYQRLAGGYFASLAERDLPSTGRWTLYLIELVFNVAAVPVNLAICYCICRTSTFHRNLRLILTNDIISGIIDQVIRIVVILDILLPTGILSERVRYILNYTRGIFVAQVTLCFLNILVERYVALRMAERYEFASTSIGIFILVFWWIFNVFVQRILQAYVLIALAVLSPSLAIFLTKLWIKRQRRSRNRIEDGLSKRYQLSENIKSLIMCRYWVYFYFVMSLIERTFWGVCILLYMADLFNESKWFGQLYCLTHAVYVMLYTLFLVMGHQNLQRRLRNLLGQRNRVFVAATAYLCTDADQNVTTERPDEINEHFRRLKDAWDAKG